MKRTTNPLMQPEADPKFRDPISVGECRWEGYFATLPLQKVSCNNVNYEMMLPHNFTKRVKKESKTLTHFKSSIKR